MPRHPGPSAGHMRRHVKSAAVVLAISCAARTMSSEVSGTQAPVF